MPDDEPALAAQRQHWERTFAARAGMFGSDASAPARAAALAFREAGLRTVLELGGGQGRDSVFLAASGFEVHALDYAQAGVAAIQRAAEAAGVARRLTAAQHDVREPLPAADGAFDACYAHMLFCMALTTRELLALSREVLRVLRPGGLCVYTVRNTSDPDFGRGVHRGEALYENQGFIVHFFDRAKVERLAAGYELLGVEEFEEGALPRRLFRVTLRMPLR
ncbi:class I SAM-dependent methyltransferase [Anaeromyxobacter diazotrophicus]|uniref:SAM-dependent methyltransferase n=1 Tax=Anaeromyxobacter diazotrophicus TaxID=2590199 RepID=A0A7I9VPR2_9BACT|nr:class I SAM-dependent methyltransferase [Anaeromyxobacter diazotrophicus]GEJ58406.1 SAM-dependent methyltransferase [Anaeromyxobacter diazotrophicus]